MADLKNHPGKWLRDDAAAAFDKAEDENGKFALNSAGRTVEEQQRLIDRWNQGGVWNRPPYLYQPANPPQNSDHVSNGGIAVDLSDWRRFAVVAANYGFSHPYPGGDPVHFAYVGKVDLPDFDPVTRDRQNFLISRGWSLVPDGREGPLTREAYKGYQRLLRDLGLYKGAIDGEWGPQTQSAHHIYWTRLNAAPKPPTPKPSAPSTTATVASFAQLKDVRGLQKIAKKNGYTGKIDNIWGPRSQAGMQNFLQRNYRGSVAHWLRSRWGYKGNDVWGPVMSAAAARANAENFRVL